MTRKGSLELLLDEDDVLKSVDEGFGDSAGQHRRSEVQNETEKIDSVELSCSVCLEAFEAGETLAWSRKLKCQHAYHHDCLIPWLMKNDDCPMCRTTLIEDSDYEMKDEEEDENDNEVAGIEIVNGLVSYVKATSYSLLRRCGDHDDQEDAKCKAPSCGEVDEELGNHSDQEEEVGTEMNKDQRGRGSGRKKSRKRYTSIATTHDDEESNEEEC